MYRLYVREAVEQGLAVSETGRVTSTGDVRARLQRLRSPSAGDAA